MRACQIQASLFVLLALLCRVDYTTARANPEDEHNSSHRHHSSIKSSNYLKDSTSAAFSHVHIDSESYGTKAMLDVNNRQLDDGWIQSAQNDDTQQDSNSNSNTNTIGHDGDTVAAGSVSGTDDGTVSSANSNRTPDFSLEASPKVRVDLHCAIDKTFCGRVAQALKDAAWEFTQVVNIKNDLVIQATYYSFCETKCANETFGWGAPSSQFTLPFEDGADLNYIYPQALAKQLAPYNNTSAWANHDIAIELNHDAYLNEVDYNQASQDGWNGTGVPPGGKYYFKGDSSIGPNQIDLEYIILHEILHGLGFISSWAAYFANEASPFRTLVDGIIDADELQLVTPSPYWYIKQQTGPIFVTGFQPTMIFDKFLYSNSSQITSSSNNSSSNQGQSLADVGFEMQNFCVQDSQSFILNFVDEFNRSNQSRIANRLWTSMQQDRSLQFHFPPPAVDNSTFNTNEYLNETYTSMFMLTSDTSMTSQVELSDRNFRLGMAISHVDAQYNSTPDFLMTDSYTTGQSLDSLVNDTYGNIGAIYFNATINGSVVQQTYKSPIGPGILRVLDSMGYSTVLSNTNYTTTGNVKSGKMPSVCDDKNNNHGMSQDTQTPTASSGAAHSAVVATSLLVLLLVNYFVTCTFSSL